MSTRRLRQPALKPPPPVAAKPFADDPSEAVRRHYEQVWHSAMHDMPFVNHALAVDTHGFARVDGDWLGVVITPWFINLFLLPGGGALWADCPTGEQRSVTLPAGLMDFFADNPADDSGLAAYQYCPLLSPVQSVADMPTARRIAAAALAAALSPPPAMPAGEAAAADADSAGCGAAGCEAVTTAPVPATAPSSARRGFLRTLAGRRE